MYIHCVFFKVGVRFITPPPPSLAIITRDECPRNMLCGQAECIKSTPFRKSAEMKYIVDL